MSTKQVTCPSCSTSYEVPAEYIGQSLHCGNCGCDFTPTPEPAKKQQPEADTQTDTDNAEKRAWKIHAEENQLPRPGASILLNFIAALAFCAGVGGAILSVHLLGVLAIIPAVSMASAGVLIACVLWGIGETIIYLARINHNVKKMREEL